MKEENELEEVWPDSDTCVTGHPYLASLIGRFFNCVLKKVGKTIDDRQGNRKIPQKNGQIRWKQKKKICYCFYCYCVVTDF